MEIGNERAQLGGDKAKASGQYTGSGSTHASQSNMIGHPSHNMFELLHRVDQSKNKSTIRFGFSDYSVLNKLYKIAASDGSSCLQYGHSSSLQDFGTKLAQTSQWKPVLDRAVSLQETNNFSSRNLDSGRGDTTLLIPEGVKQVEGAAA